jgi:hypothetical protein
MDCAQNVRGLSSILECQSVFDHVTDERHPRDDLRVDIVADFDNFKMVESCR